MAYADKQGLNGSKLASIVIVILIHAVLGYAFVTGLAFNVIETTAHKECLLWNVIVLSICQCFECFDCL